MKIPLTQRPLARTIRRTLYNKNLSAGEAAKLIQMSEGTLQSIISGHSERPYSKTLAKIARGLDLDYAELIEMRDDPEKYERRASPKGEVSRPDSVPHRRADTAWIDPPKR
jgi:transcriptional regulator with XRE-family HTH domain